jgi:hypothetical protein
MFQKIKQLFGSLGIITLISFLGALSGQNWKWLRRYIIPLLVTGYAYFLLHNWWVLTIYSMAGALSIGYGIPQRNSILVFPNPNPLSDEGSFLGRFFWNLFKYNDLLANIFTRGIIGTLIFLSMLSIPIITQNWLSYFLGSALIIGIWGAVSWRGFGSIPVKLFGKTYNLLKVDVITYMVTSCGIILIINGLLG